MNIRIGAAIAALLCLGAAPAVQDHPFYGTWTVSDAKAAPWVAAGEPAPAVNPKLAHATFVFAPTRVSAPEPLGCDKAVYEWITAEPEFLFEGGLPDPKPQARALGFATDTFPAMRFSCDRPDADLEMDYALADANTMMFALDNVIYVLKRTPPK